MKCNGRSILMIFLALTGPVCAGVLVPAGTFQMGCSPSDDWCEPDEGAPGGVGVMVPGYRVDAREVTVDQYRACVEAGKCTTPLTHQQNQYCNFGEPARGDHPVNCLDWDQALTYCRTQGGRLPSEPEWEKAARAGTKTRYPWGRNASCKQAILDEVSPAPARREPDGCYRDSTWPVASRAPNALGLYDMSGNAGEWTTNWYAPDALTAYYARGDLSGPPKGRQRVVRGGSWDENRPNVRVSFRNVKPPKQDGAIYGSIGFRCAYDVK